MYALGTQISLAGRTEGESNARWRVRGTLVIIPLPNISESLTACIFDLVIALVVE
jgi:hypothetical protein